MSRRELRLTLITLQDHKARFYFPDSPQVSNKCMDFIHRLIQDKEQRLSCRQYHAKDRVASDCSGSSSAQPDLESPYVFVNDGEDIKAHPWLRNMQWDRLHTMTPPFLPRISSAEDTHYFDDEERISDWSDSNGGRCGRSRDQPIAEAEVKRELRWYRSTVQTMAAWLVQIPADSAKLRQIYTQIETDERLLPDEKHVVKEFVRIYGPRVPKRARDKLLRDRRTKDIVMDVRMKTAFLGYTWRRMRKSPGVAYCSPVYSQAWMKKT